MEQPRFLPPEPPGPDPEIEARPAEQRPPPPPAPPRQTYGDPPYTPPQSYGYPPAPPGAPGQPPPPAHAYQQPWGHPPQQVPDNGQAVAGFVLSVVACGLLVISFGLSTIVSLGLAIGGIVCSHNGKRRVDAGETPKHRGLAQAGFVIGWVSVGLSILAIVAWILVLVLGSGDEQSIFEPDTTRAVREAIGA